MFRIVAAATLLSCGLVQPAQADSSRSHSINLAGLDLSTDAGRIELDRRIERAALAVCGAKIVGDHVGNAEIQVCRDRAVSEARKDAEILIAERKGNTKLAVHGN